MAFDLLPKKYSRFKDYKIDAFYIFLAFIVPVGLLFARYAVVIQQHGSLQARIQSSQDELRSMSAIHGVDESATFAHASLQATVKLWQLLGRSVNQSMCVNEMHRYKNKITIAGRARSIQRVGSFTDSLSDSHLFKTISLSKIADAKKQSMLEFNLHAEGQDG